MGIANPFDDHPEPFEGGQKMRGIVERVVDGDTVDVLLDLGFRVYKRVRIRVADVDTPEIYRPKDDAELQAGRAAKAEVERLVLDKPVMMSVFDEQSFSRWIGNVEFRTDDGGWADLAGHLVEHGFGEASDG